VKSFVSWTLFSSSTSRLTAPTMSGWICSVVATLLGGSLWGGNASQPLGRLTNEYLRGCSPCPSNAAPMAPTPSRTTLSANIAGCV